MNIDTFKIGDILKVTSRNNRGEEVRGAIVTGVYGDTGMVTYSGYYRLPGIIETGAGAFYPERVGTKPYGFVVAVEIVGHIEPRPYRYAGPRPGDRGYDLMC